jgi:hypothetical protein
MIIQKPTILVFSKEYVSKLKPVYANGTGASTMHLKNAKMMKSLLCGAVLDGCFYCTYILDMLISFKVCFSVHCFRWRVLFYIFLILFQHFYHGWNNLLDFYFTAMLRNGGRDWAFKMKIYCWCKKDQTAVPLIPYRCNIREFHL